MDYSRYKWIRVEKRNLVAIVTLNRPEHRNAANPEMRGELERIWLDLSEDDEINAIVLTGAGKAFCAGGDVKAMASRFGTEEGFRHSIEGVGRARRLCQNILDVAPPIVAAINGDAMGLGATLALLCDITVISETARIGDSHVKVGLVAGDGGAVFWPMLIGPHRAKDFLLRSRVINGKEALAINLVNYAAPADRVLAQAIDIAEELASQPKWAVRWTKLSINQAMKDQLNLVINTSHGLEMLSAQTADHGEAARAFAEKRQPYFTGK